jgi:hypothetical protein
MAGEAPPPRREVRAMDERHALFLTVLIADVLVIRRYGPRGKPRRFARFLGTVGRALARWSDRLIAAP